MNIKYNIEEFSRITRDISALTGISISVLDTEYNVLTNCSPENSYCALLQGINNEKEYCRECDEKTLTRCKESGKLESHICRASLYDCSMPVIKNGITAAYVIMGRIRSVSSPVFDVYLPKCDDDTAEKLKCLYTQVPYIDENRLDALYDLLPSILFNSAIELVYDTFFNEVSEYINQNLQDDLGISSLCSRFHVSKNTLYDAFRENCDTTVNEYVTGARMKRAGELLTSTDKPVYKIAEEVGIDNYTYFCRLYKRCTGFSPNEYRKINSDRRK